MLTLGRQCVYVTVDEARALLREEGVVPCDLPPGTSVTSNIPQWRGTPNERFISDVALFGLLGVDRVSALDYSSFEGAELVANLNQPVPIEWHDRFDAILDAGTLEHVFHLPQALANVGRMLRIGGRVIHVSPANNLLNHGFYQFSPTLFADFYRVNEFADLRVFVAEQASHRNVKAPVELFEVECGPAQPDLMTSPQRMFTIAVAEKAPTSTVDRIPTQGFYSRLLGSESSAASPPPSLPQPSFADRIKRQLPVALKTFLRRIIPGSDPIRRPWRLPRRGRLK